MWSKIESFRSLFICEQFLADRIRNDFHGLDYEGLFETKNKIHSSGSEKLEDSRVITPPDIKRKAIELSYDIRQAKEYYVAAENTTELTLPVLLYYGMASLGKALLDSTFECISPTKDHGLTPKGIRKVSVMPRGFFTRFHDTYNPDPTIYVSKLTFDMQELLSMIPDVRREYEEAYRVGSRINPKIDEETQMNDRFALEKDGISLVFPALTSHFLLMFLLSSLARYQPREWGKTIEGKISPEIYPIRKFLKISARRFPNLILNELFGKTFLYHPGARLG